MVVLVLPVYFTMSHSIRTYPVDGKLVVSNDTVTSEVDDIAAVRGCGAISV